MIANPHAASFLFTDLENSTPLWENYPDLMQALAARHDAIIRKAIEAHRGRVVKTTGDGFHAVFESAIDGVGTALSGQQAMIRESWPAETGPLRVRMGLHTGEARERDGDFYGLEVNRAARLMGVAHGGQVLVSGATAALVRTAPPPDVSLLYLGQHRLRGLVVAEPISQICHPSLPLEFPMLNSLSAYRHNLPVQLSTFVGREKELVEVKRLLKDAHLVTLLGPGGTGKTRLMMEVAEEAIGDFDNGVWLVELAPLTDPDLIPERVAASLTVQEEPGRPMRDSLVDYLRRKDLLLLLDNVEHLVRECAELTEHLLTHCPKLKILVTGREALFISGEITLQIPSLSLPSSSGDLALEEIRDSEGVQLFLARAQEAHPYFELSKANAAAIAEIVERLDGIPLAIELATARLRMLSVDQIAERLSDRFRLLTGGHRTALPRQQTLLALIDWSWNLLDEKERLLLQRLSVFSGGCSLGAAQAVARDDLLDEYDVFNLLEQLVNKSLVIVNYPAAGEARYGMLESIRQYGRERLVEANEGAALRDRHADHYVAFAEEAGPHLTQSTMLQWVKRIMLELDNLRAVLEWTLVDRPELALRIAGNLLYTEAQWLHPTEARAWLEPAVENARGLLVEEETKILMVDFIRALIGLGSAYAWQGGATVAIPFFGEGIELAQSNDEYRLLVLAIAMKYGANPFNITADGMQELEEAIAIGRRNKYDNELLIALGACAVSLIAQGKHESAESYLQEAIELARQINNPRTDAIVQRIRGFLARMKGNFDEAKRYTLLAIENHKALNERRSIATGQSELAHISRQEGSLEEAESYYRLSIVGWQELGQRAAVAHQVECFAFIAIARGEHEHAAKLLGAAARVRQEMNAVSEAPNEISDLALAMERLTEVMGEEERDKALAEGSLTSLDDAVQIVLNEAP